MSETNYEPVSAKVYIEQKAFSYARGIIDVFGPIYGHVFLYSKDGHSWSTEHPRTWYLTHLKICYSVCVNYQLVKEGEKINVRTWSNGGVYVLGVKK